MKYQTTLMREILTNSKAQEMIDYVSQIYGDSYVGLWLFQAIGSILGPIYEGAEQLQYETSPTTATILLDQWEQSYGLEPDSDLDIDQRRARIVSAMKDRGACTPARLANAVSAALGGAPVEVLERTGQNQFIVNIRAAVKSLAPAKAAIERLKPAHLTYRIQGVVQEAATVPIYIGTTITHAVTYNVEVKQ